MVCNIYGLRKRQKERQHYRKLLTSPNSTDVEVSKMVSEKVLHFQGKNKDLNQLSQQIIQQLSAGGYKTQSSTAPLGIVIQAKKAGILRDIITADRAFSILITGEPNDFSIHIGIGKLIQNLAVAAVEVLFLTTLFLAIDVPEMLWTEHVERGIVKEITQIVELNQK
jgi:hypothetical protein